MTDEQLDHLAKIFHDAYKQHRGFRHIPRWEDLTVSNKLGVLDGLRAILKELDIQLCPRCHKHPRTKVFLGKEGEGHICGQCWIDDRNEEESWLMS